MPEMNADDTLYASIGDDAKTLMERLARELALLDDQRADLYEQMLPLCRRLNYTFLTTEICKIIDTRRRQRDLQWGISPFD